MKRLTENEIKFIKETGFTWTVLQCNEWHKTPFKDCLEAEHYAWLNYNKLSLEDLLGKFDEYDGISLEYTATYLFYTFFTKEELEKLTPEEGIEWLKDMRYFCGYRKWGADDIAPFIKEALEVYNGTREFYEWEGDKEIWNKEIG